MVAGRSSAESGRSLVLLHGAESYGAVERYVEQIARGASKAGWAVVVVHPDHPELAPFSALGAHGIVLEPYDRALLHGHAWHLLRELARRLRSHRPTAVHVADVAPIAQLAARIALRRRVFTTHHTPELPRRDSAAGRLWWQLGWAARPEVIYTSETDRRTDGRRLLRTHVVPLGIDLDCFATAQRAIPWSGPVVGNVARLAEQKGHATLLDAASRVLERRPDVLFVVAGEGELRPELERRAAELGLGDRFRLLGQRDDIPEVLASLDVFAFPSRFEGLCLAVIEAQAAGVPVVATPVGGIRETVVDGETGRLVPTGDPDALAEAVLALLATPEHARALAERAREQVRARFSIERMVAGTIPLYGS